MKVVPGQAWRFALALLLVALAAACGADEPSSGEPAGSEDLVVALSQLPDILDPKHGNPQAKVHLNLMFDHLVGTDPSGRELSPETGVATAWESEDRQVWTFRLRDDLTFSDGSPVTAADVVFSLERVLAEDARAVNSSYLRSLVKSVEQTSDTEVVITLSAPDFTLPYYLSPLQGTEGMIVPKAYVEEVGEEAFGTAPVGSGPYELTDVNPGVSVTYTRRGTPHPTYGTARYRTIEFRSMPEQGARTAALEVGEVDLIDVDLASARLDDLRAAGFTIFEKERQNVIGVQFHTQWKPVPVGNKDIRKALTLAVNSQEINESIYQGLGDVTGVAFLGSLGIGYPEDLPPYLYDPDEARRLLAETGYDGAPIDIYAFDIAGIPGLARTAEAIAGYWEAVGVNVKLNPIDYASFRPLWFEQSTEGATAPIGIANNMFSLSVFEIHYSSDGATSYAKDPEFDALVEQMRATTGDEEAYAAMTPTLARYVYDNYMTLPLLEIGSFYAANDNVPESWDLGIGRYDININGLVRQESR